MKQFVLLSMFILSARFSYCQVPRCIPYQAIARNNVGGVIANQTIHVRFTIHDSTTGGSVVYQETFSPHTSSSGQFNFNIGTGTPSSGSFASINWAVNSKFMQVELDPAGGSAYIDMGTTQMMSVPYALYSNSAGSINQSGSNSNTLLYLSDGF